MLFIHYTQPLWPSKQAHSHHDFADDNQLYKVSTLDAVHQSIEAVQNCTTNIKSWMNANKLQLNDNKTKAIVILSGRMSIHSPLPSVVHIGDANVPFMSSVKNLGVILDSNLSMSQHVQSHRHTNQAYKFHTTSHHSSSPNPCVLSVFSCLDYSNFSGCP